MTPNVERAIAKVADLKPSPYNPRKISTAAFEGLSKSIDEFGLVQDIVVNRRNMHVVGGHQRLKVLKAKKVVDVPVIFVDLDDTAEKTLNIALNNPHAAGEFDGGLREILESIQSEDDDLFQALQFEPLLPERYAGAGAAGDTGVGLGDPVVSYQIVFDNEEQQSDFYKLLTWLKRKYSAETIGARIAEFARDTING